MLSEGSVAVEEGEVLVVAAVVERCDEEAAVEPAVEARAVVSSVVSAAADDEGEAVVWGAAVGAAVLRCAALVALTA